MTLPVLYSFRRCPYAMRARLALHSAGQAVELREVALRAKPAELLAASSQGTVPVLVLAGGEVLAQSLDIMCWALARSDPQGWLSAAPWGQQEAWVSRNDGEFKVLLDRYKYPQRHPQASAVSGIGARDAACALLLAPLEQALAGRCHLFGETGSLADMAMLPFVRQFAAVDPAWFAAAPLPGVQAWLQRFVDGELFKAVMRTRWPVWVPDDSSVHLHNR